MAVEPTTSTNSTDTCLSCCAASTGRAQLGQLPAQRGERRVDHGVAERRPLAFERGDGRGECADRSFIAGWMLEGTRKGPGRQQKLPKRGCEHAVIVSTTMTASHSAAMRRAILLDACASGRALPSDNRPMHLLVPFASDDSEACRHVLRDLALPNLSRLLARLEPAARDDGDCRQLLAAARARPRRALRGWRGGDGALPFAAHAAAADGIATGDARLGPADAERTGSSAATTPPCSTRPRSASTRPSRAPCSRRSAGCSRARASPSPGARRALVRRRTTSCDGFATASLDRVIGRNVDRWLRRDRARRSARRVRRLQSEAQLVFHAHPVNEAREARGEPVGELVLAERLRPAPGGGCGAAEPSVDALAARAAARRRLGGLGRGLAAARRRRDRRAAGRARRRARADPVRRAQRRALRAAPRSAWQRLRRRWQRGRGARRAGSACEDRRWPCRR